MINKSNLFDPNKQRLMAEQIGAMRKKMLKDTSSPQKQEKSSSFFQNQDLQNNLFA